MMDQAQQNAITILPSHGWAALNLHEIWEYRELLYFLIWRDIKIRYKQTLLGAAWAIIQPFLVMVIFSIFFGRLGKIPSDGIPYPIFSYVALLPWNYFAQSLGNATSSVVSSAHLIRKVYFPRLVIPVSSVLSGVIDFAVAFSVLFAMMPYYGIMPTAKLLLLPFILLFAMTTALGTGLWLSALNVHYRDIHYVTPFLIQSWLFATPVVYPSSLLHEPWRTLYGLNPMVGVIESSRWVLLGTSPSLVTLTISGFVSFALLVSGAFYFRRMERTFADVI